MKLKRNRAGRWIDAAGRFVSRAAVRGEYQRRARKGAKTRAAVRGEYQRRARKGAKTRAKGKARPSPSARSQARERALKGWQTRRRNQAARESWDAQWTPHPGTRRMCLDVDRADLPDYILDQFHRAGIEVPPPSDSTRAMIGLADRVEWSARNLVPYRIAYTVDVVDQSSTWQVWIYGARAMERMRALFGPPQREGVSKRGRAYAIFEFQVWRYRRLDGRAPPDDVSQMISIASNARWKRARVRGFAPPR